jgi:hypothetical protein
LQSHINGLRAKCLLSDKARGEKDISEIAFTTVCAFSLQRLNLLECIERAVGERLDIVVVQREQAQAGQILERVLADARDLVGVEQQQLQRCQSLEHTGRQLLDLVAVENQRVERL